LEEFGKLMGVMELHPHSLEDLQDWLPEKLEKAQFKGIRLRSSRESLTIETPSLHRGYEVQYELPAFCAWHSPKGAVRIGLRGFLGKVVHRDGESSLTVREAPKPLGEFAEYLWQKPRNPIQQAFLARGLRVLTDLEELEEAVISAALAEPTDSSALVAALSSPAALAKSRDLDPFLEARLRGVAARMRLLQSHGGALAADEAAEALGMTRQGIDKRRKAGKLLALELGSRGFHYPAWQFTPAGVLAGLEETLHALEVHDSWSRLIFFVSKSDRLGGKCPIEALGEGHLSAVLAAAQLYGEQGGT
jgi:hypothetical protein